MVNIDITDKMICTFKGPTGQETTCTGDSGGPLMVRRSGRFVLVGATSFSLVEQTMFFRRKEVELSLET